MDSRPSRRRLGLGVGTAAAAAVTAALIRPGPAAAAGVCLLNQPVFAEDGTGATYAHVYCSGGEVHLTDPISWNHSAGASGRPARALRYVREGAGRIFVNGDEIA